MYYLCFMCIRTHLCAQYKISSVLYVDCYLFFSLCHALSCKESFSESMNAEVGTFLSRHTPMGVLSITGSSQNNRCIDIKIRLRF